MTTNKNFELFHEYQKRIVDELLEEYSSKGITLLKDEGENGNMYLAINGNKLLYTRWNGDIEVTKNFITTNTTMLLAHIIVSIIDQNLTTTSSLAKSRQPLSEHLICTLIL